MKSTEYTRHVICPHCGHADDAWADNLNDDLDGPEICECAECRKPFLLQVEILVNFSTTGTTYKELAYNKILETADTLEWYREYDYLEYIPELEEKLTKLTEKYENTNWEEE